MPSSDAESIHALRQGDQSAFADLYDRHARWVRALCYDTTRNLGEAQDLAQDVFLRAYQNLATLREPERFGGWLHAITKRVCLEWLRRRRSHGNDAVLAALPSPEPLTDDEAIEHLRQAIADLPEAEREAVHLFYLLDQSAESAGEVLNLSRSGLYRLLGRARKRLERAMRSERENAR